MNFDLQHEEYRRLCEASIKTVVAELFQPGSQVSRAAEYALLNGGKRVRGVLVLAVCDMLGGDKLLAARFSTAIEMIHAFSLVHDDLPSMDDDDTRRGKPATHIAFGEANALLAGDALAIEAFRAITQSRGEAATLAGAVTVLAKAAGARGMIYGQELDLYYETQPADAEALATIEQHKTGALISVSAELGILAAGRAPEDEVAIAAYAGNIGPVFQIVDDVLDVTSTTEVLGKPVGSDAEQGKTTFVSMHGMQKAREEIARLTDEAVAALKSAYGERSEFLCTYAQTLANRVN